MKQQDISQQLGSLIGQTQGVYNTTAADEAIPAELKEPDPIFEIDHDDEQTKARKEAYLTISYIVGSIVPEEYKSDPMIQNKMKIDAYQLGMLYYQQKMNNIALQAAMDVLAKGDTQPRMFEVIDKLQKRASDLSLQITETQNQFRKYYIDAYLDIESKRHNDESNFNNPTSSNAKSIEQKDKNSLTVTQDGGVKVISTKQSVQELQRLKIERAKNKAKEVEYQELSSSN